LPAAAAAITRSAWVTREQALGDPAVGAVIVQRLLARRRLGAVALGQALGRAGVDIDHVAQARLGLPGQVGGVDLPDPAGPELRELDHARLSSGIFRGGALLFVLS